MLAPCKKCEQRFFGCHSQCRDYLQFTETVRAVKDLRRKELDRGRAEWTQYQREKRKGRHQSNKID